MTSVRAFASACFWVLVKTPSTNFTFTKGMSFPFTNLERGGVQGGIASAAVRRMSALNETEGAEASGRE
jgi:hypothetical protein